MLYMSEFARVILLWTVGRLLMLDHRVSTWQARRSAARDWSEEETLPARRSVPPRQTVPLPSFWEENKVNAKGGCS